MELMFKEPKPKKCSECGNVYYGIGKTCGKKCSHIRHIRMMRENRRRKKLGLVPDAKPPKIKPESPFPDMREIIRLQMIYNHYNRPLSYAMFVRALDDGSVSREEIERMEVNG